VAKDWRAPTRQTFTTLPEQLRNRSVDLELWASRRADVASPLDRRRYGLLTPAFDHALDPVREQVEVAAPARAQIRRLQDQMLGAVLRGEGIEGLARIAAASVGAPVMIVIPEMIGTVARSAEADNNLASLESWAQERTLGRPTAIRDELVAETPIVLGERTVGVVGVARTSAPLSPLAHWTLDVVAAVAATAVALDEARLETEHALRGSFLEQLRAGAELSRAEIVRRSARFGCDLSMGAIALCVEVTANRPRLVATAIADEYPGAFAEPVDLVEDERLPQVWALLPAAALRPGGAVRTAEELEEAAKRLATRLRQYGAVGLSRVHQDPTELTRAIDEAELMLEVVRRVAGPTGDEIVDGTYKLLFRLLASHPDELHNYHETTIAPLVRHDDQYRTDLVRTLEAYLETNCNMNMAAELVFAHRHTVAHRLERIQELTGLDAAVHEDREQLGLGLKIHRLTA
jgi:sugar diacid utilization regulator